MERTIKRVKHLLSLHKLDGVIIRNSDSVLVYIDKTCLQVYAEHSEDYLQKIFREVAAKRKGKPEEQCTSICNVIKLLQEKRPERIGITGLAGAGKDTVGAILAEHMPAYYKTSYAAPLRRAAAMLFGHSDESLKSTPVYVNAKAHRHLVQAIEHLCAEMQLPYGVLMQECNDLLEQRSLSPRKFMQMLGSAVRRIDEDAFIKHLQTQPQRQIVCDVRFPNELCDVNILVVRPECAAMQHPSEQYAKDLTDAVLSGVLPEKFITIVNDGTKQDLLFKLNGTKVL